MPRLDSTIRISVPVGDEDVILVCRRPSADEVSKFLNSRFTTHRNKVKSNLYPARVAFVDSILVDAENVTFVTASGEEKPLNAATVLTPDDASHWSKVLGEAVSCWKDLISMPWKSTVAMYFEEQQGGGEEQGN